MVPQEHAVTHENSTYLNSWQSDNNLVYDDVFYNTGGHLLCAYLFRHALCEEFRPWLSAVTQIVLEPTIDISCAKYEYTGQSISDPFPKASVHV